MYISVYFWLSVLLLDNIYFQFHNNEIYAFRIPRKGLDFIETLIEYFVCVKFILLIRFLLDLRCVNLTVEIDCGNLSDLFRLTRARKLFRVTLLSES